MIEKGPLSGFRDLLAREMIPRQQMIDTIRKIYEGYGFTPLETPALERLETLTGKYGPEGEKLIYKFQDHGGRDVALRYDLTVPLARVVGQHRDKITIPYKRYQIGPVWRGESPQAGRFREFYQFDADTVGASGALADAEIVAMMADTMTALGVGALVRVNNRRVLDALAEKSGLQSESEVKKLIITVDKTEKIGKDAVLTELGYVFDPETVKLVDAYLSVSGGDADKLLGLAKLLGNSRAAQEGLENLNQVFQIMRKSGYSEDQITFDQTIARGLEYYTGIIYETTLVKLPGIGSVCSGGRYDKLVAALGGPDLPAVGTSVGVDRLFTALQQIGKLPSTKTKSQVLIANFDDQYAPEYMGIATKLRRAGISTEVYYNPDRLSKQMKLADKLGIPYVVLQGPEELENGVVTVKNLQTREQQQLTVEEFVTSLKS